MHAEIVMHVKAVYDQFFKPLEIDPHTGELAGCGKKLATYPYIGSRYGDPGHTKLLIVGLDIGSDETPGRIQAFEERRRQIEDHQLSNHNPHIAGTYMTALYFLRRESPEWLDYWQNLDGQVTCKQLLKQDGKLPRENPLSYIAFTNYHKFVTMGRTHRAGGKDRAFINKKVEEQLFAAEVKALNPEIIVLQGEQFSTPYNKVFNRIVQNCRLFIGPHPSGRKGHVRRPRTLIDRIAPW